MSLPWGLPYLLKVQGRWLRVVTASANDLLLQTCQNQNRNQFIPTNYFACLSSFLHQTDAYETPPFLSVSISLSRFQNSFPSVGPSLRLGWLEWKPSIPNWGISPDTHMDNWRRRARSWTVCAVQIILPFELIAWLKGSWLLLHSQLL